MNNKIMFKLIDVTVLVIVSVLLFVSVVFLILV